MTALAIFAAAVSLLCLVLGLSVRRLLRERRALNADAQRLAQAVAGLMRAGDVHQLREGLTWLRREFLWLDHRWPALAAEARRMPLGAWLRLLQVKDGSEDR